MIEKNIPSDKAHVQCPYCKEWIVRNRPLAIWYGLSNVEEFTQTNCEHCNHVFFFTARCWSSKPYEEIFMINNELVYPERENKSKCNHSKTHKCCGLGICDNICDNCGKNLGR